LLKRIIQVITFFLLIFIHIGFLTVFLVEKFNEIWVLLGVIIASAIITYAYYHISPDKEDFFLADLQDVFYIGIGAVITYFLSVDMELGPVIAAAACGTVASFIPDLFSASKNMEKIPTRVYCGAFIGMTAPQVAYGYGFILFASLLAGVLFIGTKNYLNGFGGKLGTIAFGGVAVTSFLIYLFF
tara:strand:- start:5983 stop:6537 length:555 start_codon:yes stop_codon:yes gene_type:complete